MLSPRTGEESHSSVSTFANSLRDAHILNCRLIDLQKGWKYVLENYPEVDPDRAVAAGASYGGYAIKLVR